MESEIRNYLPKNEVERNDKKMMIDAIENELDVYTRQNTKNHFCVSAWIVDETFTKVLMVYHNIYDSWSWVGGHLDGELDSRKKILEEVAEETGVTKVKFLDQHIISLEVLEVKEHVKNGQVIAKHNHFDTVYLLQADSSEKLRIKEDENKDVAWIPMDQIADKVKEKDMLPLYAKLNERALSYK